MRIFNSFIHSLALPLLIVFTQTTWAGDTQMNNVAVQNRVNIGQTWQNPAGVSHINPSSSIYVHSSQQVDDRISDIIAENVLHFGHNLGLQLAALDPYASRSEIFSPLSIISALSFLALGAKGKSYQELKQILALDSDNELVQNPSKYHEEFGLLLNDVQHTNVNGGGINRRPNANWRYTTIKAAPVRSTGQVQENAEHIIKVANGMFLQSGYTVNPDYSQVIQSIYKSEIAQLDFQFRSREARDYINAWVNQVTYGKIPQIINSDIEKTTNIILASVLYFKAFWETSFFPKATVEDYFYPDGVNNPPIKVQMMPTGGVFPFYDAKEYDCRIIGLPYKGNETTMYVIQPNNSSRQKLRELQFVLDARKINKMIDNMERKTTVMVFPKMHFTRTMTMKTLLKNMNVRSIFINGYSDLSLIIDRLQKGLVSVTTQFAQIKPQNGLRDAASVIAQSAPIKPPVSFQAINRKLPLYKTPQLIDTFQGPTHVYSRFGDIMTADNNTEKMLMMNEDTVTTFELPTPEKPENSSMTGTNKSSNIRKKRQVPNIIRNPVQALFNLETIRQKVDSSPVDLFVDDILHKVDFSVDEQGTEAAAATLTYLHRSGTDVVFRGDTPFLIVIRHDPTKLPLFYGIINKPEL